MNSFCAIVKLPRADLSDNLVDLWQCGLFATVKRFSLFVYWTWTDFNLCWLLLRFECSCLHNLSNCTCLDHLNSSFVHVFQWRPGSNWAIWELATNLLKNALLFAKVLVWRLVLHLNLVSVKDFDWFRIVGLFDPDVKSSHIALFHQRFLDIFFDFHRHVFTVFINIFVEQSLWNIDADPIKGAHAGVALLITGCKTGRILIVKTATAIVLSHSWFKCQRVSSPNNWTCRRLEGILRLSIRHLSW